MSTIVELNTRELNNISGGLPKLIIAGATSIYFGIGRFISDVRNNGCDNWKETGRSSKTMCYLENTVMEGVWHGAGDLYIMDALERYLPHQHRE